jgi:nucleotide-binding universal stress UspA family protein
LKKELLMFKNILLATDGSVHAEKARKYAQKMAQRDEAQVIVLHAFEPISPVWGEPMREDFIEKNVARGEKVTEDARSALEDAGVDTEVKILEGNPADTILRVAKKDEVDLILMGTRGLSEPTSLLLGSVSHRVLAHSHVPVMVVRAEMEEE